jgi:hypothetical protein
MVNRQKKALGWVDTIRTGARMVTGKKLGQAINSRAVDTVQGSYAKGGMVKTRGRKTAVIRAHAGEAVLSKSAVKMLKKMLR